MFYPGAVWLDDTGQLIQAHGGCLLNHQGIYYWFGENKDGDTRIMPNNLNRVDSIGISCYSSKDLYHWHHEGIVLPSVTDDHTHVLHFSKVMERPKVIFDAKNKRFVMWLHVDNAEYSLAQVAVAVADQPYGPYHYLHSFRPFGLESRDMTLFQDTDGRAYVVFSSYQNKTLVIGSLSEDYLRTGDCFLRRFEGQSREAPALFKHNTRYYMITSGCTGWDPNEALYAVAASIWGEWQACGNPCRGVDAEQTFFAQSTFVFPLVNSDVPFLFMADRWNRLNLRESRYVWLPISLDGDAVTIDWHESWRWERKEGQTGVEG